MNIILWFFLRKRLNRLWNHLLIAESQIGTLRDSPHGKLTDCPIANFVPATSKRGNKFSGITVDGVIGYRLDYSASQRTFITNEQSEIYHIYEYSDTLWWQSLPKFIQREITLWVQEMIEVHYQSDKSKDIE
jgi:hypothetical protein